MHYPDFSRIKVIVIGDVMLDRYWHGDTSRISPEAPVPVVKIDRHEDRVGGAANVAVNVRTLGAVTTLISVVGADDAGNKLMNCLAEYGVNSHFLPTGALNTTLKLRVLGRHQQLIRLDFEDKQSVSCDLILETLAQEIVSADILILSDYAKGMISDPQALIHFAKQHGVKVLVDPKNADLSVYRGATVLTPNLGEFEATAGACPTEAILEAKGNEYLRHLDLEALLITRGSQGMTLIQKNHLPVHIPSVAREVFDITGAGDTVIGVLGAALATGSSVLESATLANFAAGLSVAKLGTATITPEELSDCVMAHKNPASGVVQLDELLSAVRLRKSRGQKIVMTNGCFDILHAGHVQYLREARELGDCLIIAVNDDASVGRLKGPTRPINRLTERMQVLAALGCVDFVVDFSEDTPERLIKQITPDILVKGGDYEVDQIAGGEHVIARGGAVKILPFVPGCSTTRVIKRMLVTEEVGV